MYFTTSWFGGASSPLRQTEWWHTWAALLGVLGNSSGLTAAASSFKLQAGRAISPGMRYHQTDRGWPFRHSIPPPPIIWSPDSQTVAYGANQKGRNNMLFQRKSDGTGGEQLLTESANNKFPTSWSA